MYGVVRRQEMVRIRNETLAAKKRIFLLNTLLLCDSIKMCVRDFQTLGMGLFFSTRVKTRGGAVRFLFFLLLFLKQLFCFAFFCAAHGKAYPATRGAPGRFNWARSGALAPASRACQPDTKEQKTKPKNGRAEGHDAYVTHP